jgi:alkylation response protein AidB-like acyl-CoA dehydrogenase
MPSFQGNVNSDDAQKRLAEELLFAEKKNLSFVKQLYFGHFDSLQVFPFPHPSLSEEESTQRFVDEIGKFAMKQIDPVWIDRHATIPDQVIQGLCQKGVMGMTVPKELGGLGMSYRAYCRITETLARQCCSTALFVNVHQSIGLKAILLFGTPEQQGRWLPPLARGKEIAAFSLTEPQAGSDVSSIETRATFDPNKNIYILNGQKQWTTHGSIASVLTVMAKTEVETSEGKQDKITAFLVTPHMPGFKVTAAALDKVGMRGTKTANLSFTHMEVPAANVLGPLGAGLKICLTVLDYGRTTFGASCTGVAKNLLEQAVFHARTRIQFKRPLAAFELVKKKISYIAALTYAMEATTYLTAGLIDKGVGDFMLEAAILKVFASDALWSIIYDTMQIFGGRSFFTEAPFERMMRDARLNMIGEGANEVLRVFIAAVGMRDVGVELKEWVEGIKNPWNHFSSLQQGSFRLFQRLFLPTVSLRAPQLRGEAKALSRLIRRFGTSVIRLLAHYREQVVEHQLELDRIATTAIAIYTTTAVLSKLDYDIETQGIVPCALQISAAKLYCYDALRTGNICLDTLFTESDSLLTQTANLFTQIS